MHPIDFGNAITAAAALLAVSGVLIAIIISIQKHKQAKLDLLRSAIERGDSLSPELIDKVMRPKAGGVDRRPFPPGKGALVAGMSVIAFGVGYAVFSGFISLIAPSALFPMLGVSCLFLCIGIGLLVISRVLRSGDPQE